MMKQVRPVITIVLFVFMSISVQAIELIDKGNYKGRVKR